MKYITDIANLMDKHKISAAEQLDILSACNDYLESQRKEIKIKAVQNFAKMVEDMRDIQISKGNASKQEQAVDRAITQINKYK